MPDTYDPAAFAAYLDGLVTVEVPVWVANLPAPPEPCATCNGTGRRCDGYSPPKPDFQCVGTGHTHSTCPDCLPEPACKGKGWTR